LFMGASSALRTMSGIMLSDLFFGDDRLSKALGFCVSELSRTNQYCSPQRKWAYRSR
jgi:hypothetical protein